MAKTLFTSLKRGVMPLVSALLIACGGSGGGSPSVATPVVTPVTVTENLVCPTGEAKSATAPTRQEAYEMASGQCPKITGSFPANGASPQALLEGVTFVSNGTMQVPNVQNVTIQLPDPNGTIVPIVISDFTPTTFKIRFLTLPNYSQTLYFKAVLSDSLGRQFTVISSFTTGFCPADSTVSLTGDACVYRMGIQLKVPTVDLPTSMSLTTDAAFRAATKKEALLVATGVKAVNSSYIADVDRCLVFAVYRQSGKTIAKLLFCDTLTDVEKHNDLLSAGMRNAQFDRVMGDPKGLIIRGQPGNVCWIASWFGNTAGYAPGSYFDVFTGCPVVWTSDTVQPAGAQSASMMKAQESTSSGKFFNTFLPE